MFSAWYLCTICAPSARSLSTLLSIVAGASAASLASASPPDPDDNVDVDVNVDIDASRPVRWPQSTTGPASLVSSMSRAGEQSTTSPTVSLVAGCRGAGPRVFSMASQVVPGVIAGAGRTLPRRTDRATASCSRYTEAEAGDWTPAKRGSRTRADGGRRSGTSTCGWCQRCVRACVRVCVHTWV